MSEIFRFADPPPSPSVCPPPFLESVNKFTSQPPPRRVEVPRRRRARALQVFRAIYSVLQCDNAETKLRDRSNWLQGLTFAPVPGRDRSRSGAISSEKTRFVRERVLRYSTEAFLVTRRAVNSNRCSNCYQPVAYSHEIAQGDSIILVTAKFVRSDIKFQTSFTETQRP